MAGAAVLLPIPLTSPPEQKAVPAPVTSSAPTSGSSPLRLIIRRNAGVRWSDNELRAPGRFKVITATRSRISHSSSSVPVSTAIEPFVMVLTFHILRALPGLAERPQFAEERPGRPVLAVEMKQFVGDGGGPDEEVV